MEHNICQASAPPFVKKYPIVSRSFKTPAMLSAGKLPVMENVVLNEREFRCTVKKYLTRVHVCEEADVLDLVISLQFVGAVGPDPVGALPERHAVVCGYVLISAEDAFAKAGDKDVQVFTPEEMVAVVLAVEQLDEDLVVVEGRVPRQLTIGALDRLDEIAVPTEETEWQVDELASGSRDVHGEERQPPRRGTITRNGL